MAPKLKTYCNADGREMYPAEVAKLLGDRQGNYLVTATTKAAAIELLQGTGRHWYLTPSNLRVSTLGMWTGVKPILRDLEEPGAIFYVPSPRKGSPIVRAAAAGTLTIVGTWDYTPGPTGGLVFVRND
jgi:hypothetical protein